MEIRFLHDPEATEGYVSATYSSNVFRDLPEASQYLSMIP
jgi:hypothetical protein